MEKDNFKIQWRISCAGLAGDPDKLLYGTYRGVQLHEMFRSGSLFDWSLKRAKKRLKRRFKILD